jgi:hypothetical protein
MAYKIRVILDVEEDVIRDLIVNESISLESLHFTIAKSFGFNGQEMASFYRADEYWEQGVEIPLCNMLDEDDEISMGACQLSEIMRHKNDKLIYVYDFFSMWTFFVELVDPKAKSLGQELSKTVFSFGNRPDKAPEKEFTSEDLYNSDDNYFDNDFEDDSEIDFDNY